MDWNWLTGMFSKEGTEEAAEKPPEILVLGAELVCPCGSSHSYLNLDTVHVSIADLPQANVTDCKALDNILSFGTCRQSRRSISCPCEKRMELAEEWKNPEPQTMLVNGEEAATTDSTLICYASGREIYAVTSGQEKENKFAEYKKLCEEMEEAYPGLLAILTDPHGSLYLEEGMYEKAIRFLEDYLEERNGEVSLPELYDMKEPKDALVVAALDRLLTDCDGNSYERIFNGLENTSVQTGMDQKEGWDIHKLNLQMIEMLKIDCKATAEKVNTSSFARWTEEHKKFVDILGDVMMDLAYNAMLLHCTTASSETRAAGEAVGKEEPTTSKPIQNHHYATNKNKTYTPQFEEIANKYGLNLDDDWNKEFLSHQGRHPNAYHDYVLDSMKQFDEIAQGDQSVFLKLYENMKKIIRDNQSMLYKEYWNQ